LQINPHAEGPSSLREDFAQPVVDSRIRQWQVAALAVTVRPFDLFTTEGRAPDKGAGTTFHFTTKYERACHKANGFIFVL
jgi:hypothetical protein